MSWTDEDRHGLGALLDVLIPPPASGAKPAGSAMDLVGYVERAGISDEILAGVRRFLHEYGVREGVAFLQIPAAERQPLVKVWERKQGAFFRTFIKHVMHCYYQDPRVLGAIGVEPRPPFPDGYVVPEGDLTLLEPVFERGRVYR